MGKKNHNGLDYSMMAVSCHIFNDVSYKTTFLLLLLFDCFVFVFCYGEYVE